mmetsp:Transcript_2894/g.2395  ORF Transcript_2894/g.2395 Transcript_2894/m.2395 type:complete len:219 (+) Transcript_2894:28-684(+)
MKGEYNTKNKEPISSMIRSRECRKRKKEYLINLEKKVDRLEKENCELKEENKQLKESVNNQSTTTRTNEEILKSNVQYYQKLSNDVISDPEKIRLSMLEQSLEEISEWSDSRIGIIKELFKKIIDNICPEATKIWHSFIKNTTVETFKKKNSTKKRHRKYINKDMSVQDIFYEEQFSNGLVKVFHQHWNQFNTTNSKFQEIIHDIVKVRNKLLNHYID